VTFRHFVSTIDPTLTVTGYIAKKLFIINRL
jgi:hypothetical protein